MSCLSTVLVISSSGPQSWFYEGSSIVGAGMSPHTAGIV